MNPKFLTEATLSYYAVYDQELREEMEELGLISDIDEDRDGYGDESKFKQDTDADSFRPGKDVPKVRKFGRISRSIPHGIGAHANRTQSRVSTIVGKDPGAPRSEKLPQEPKKPKMVKRDGKWVKEAYDIVLEYLFDEGYASTVENAEEIMGNMSQELIDSIVESKENYDLYDLILSHLLDEGYVETEEAAEAIMVNMSEEWRDSIIEAKWGKQPLPDKKMTDKAKKLGNRWLNTSELELGSPESKKLLSRRSSIIYQRDKNAIK